MATNNRRRKTEQGVAACLSSVLPIGILEHAASFLAAPTRALFAVALTTNHDPSGENYSSIAGTDDWDTLDFGEIEKDLAKKLSDDDLNAVLQHIDAFNQLKRLRLSNCTNISGSGLKPLRGSTIIEQIDLALSGVGENRMLDLEPPISCEAVLPILDSIIAADGCSLRHLQFPHKWTNESGSAFHAFLVRYNEMRDNRDTVTCLNCGGNLPPDGLNEWITTRSHWIDTRYCKLYAKHNYTCYQCTKHYCHDCPEDDDGDLLGSCTQCQRDYCRECAEVGRCRYCNCVVCEHCMYGCSVCCQQFCKSCCNSCSYCSLGYCNDCNEDNVHLCAQCSNCLPEEVALLEQSNKKLQEEVEQLKNENRELRRLKEEVEQLKSENRELKLENKVLKDKETA